MGPTASGKTSLAVDLVQCLSVEIISVDSALVYRHMDIGTAKPDESVLSKAPHRLIDIREPEVNYSAADFCSDAINEMADITAAGNIPLLVGGTMLYFRSLYQGLSTLPSADAQVRQRLEKQAEEEGWPAMYERLTEVDPVAAARIHPNDPQRIQRALEVFEISGKSLSWHFEHQGNQDFPYDVVQIALIPPSRQRLHEQIAQRFEQMLELGFLDEVKSLMQRPGFDKDLPSMKAVGYRQALKYLNGDYTYEEMVDKAVIATRQLAKRQMTWLRSMPETHHIEAGDSTHVDKIKRLIESSCA